MNFTGATRFSRSIAMLALTLAVLANLQLVALAQTPVPPPAPAVPLLAGAELDTMLQPIALYPDPLMGQVLAAATLPLEVVQADRYLTSGGDPNLIGQQPWDLSVQGLARYPTVLKWMDGNLAWTTALGQAFVLQPQDVMDSVQRLRAKAQSLGNLTDSPQEHIVANNGEIEILPADPQIIYVPVYQPDLVYDQRWIGGSPFITFGIGFPVGAWLGFDFDWHSRRLMEWGRDRPRPGDWWTRHPGQRVRAEMPHATAWHSPGRANAAVGRGDRGFNVVPSRPAPAVHSGAGAATERRAAPPATPRSAPAITQHAAPAPPARPAQGALIGVQSSHQTQQFSNRGQQSRQAAPKAAAPTRSAEPARAMPSSHSTGGGMEKSKR
jgi:hypothetical protein